MNTRLSFACLLVSTALAGSVPLSAAEIGFDDVPSGSLVDGNYSRNGILLSSVVSQSGHAYVASWQNNNTVSLWNPATMGVFSSTFAAEEGAVKAVFATPQKKVSIDALGVEAIEFLGTDASLQRRPFLEAFDANSKLLAKAYYANWYGDGKTGWGKWQTLTIERPQGDIAYVLFSSIANPPGQRGRVHAQAIYGVFDNLRTYPQSASNYVGCYTDEGVRALPVQLMAAGATAETCIAAAKAHNYAYAGLQSGGQCFAGNAPALSKMADAECNMPCSADKSETCGGSWRNSIYATGVTTPKPAPPVYQGCYADTPTRELPVTLMATSSATLDTCVAAARARNLAYAGLQYGGQCYGGNSPGKTKVADSECNMPCAANAGETCGGTWRNSVYATGAAVLAKVPAIAYKGCYVDSSNRTLPIALMSSGATVESCVAAAKRAGYTYAGLQWQGQCYAGNTLPPTKAQNAECNTPCQANTQETCGGAWRNSVYSTSWRKPYSRR